jgi:arylsulfatase
MAATASDNVEARSLSEMPSTSSTRSKPNILMIVLDDVGFADLGCYGSEIETPAIDELANAGLRLNNFHAAPLCTPTRAALLTGYNPHSVGAGVIADWADDRPGYRGVITPNVPTLPELLRQSGYSCYATGKWHLNAIREQGTTGPFGNWPTQRGFDKWYGFQGANADQWHPELFEGTSAIEVQHGEGYHLSADIIDRLCGYLVDHVAGAEERPFFGYLAFGACHWPQQVPAEWIAAQRGKYDAGWSVLRDERYARQVRNGMLPATTAMPPENPDVPRWETLSSEDRRFAARCQEVYAAFLSHTDAQIGRLLSKLTELGVREDTIIVLLSDNGATAEGSAVGMADVRREIYMGKEPMDERLSSLDALGSERSFPAYPLGWAQASNTPFRWYKSSTHEGGIRTPLILNWPKGEFAKAEVRSQFHHVSDVAPTLFELAGLSLPRFEGTSFVYALRDAEAPTRKAHQLFEATGSRALWYRGWKAVARHSAGSPFSDDRWELYNLDTDYAEAVDMTEAEPRRLRMMQRTWMTLARAGQVLPLDDRRLPKYRANLPPRRSRYVLVPGGSRLDRLTMPDVQRAHRISFSFENTGQQEGVILCAGNLLRGYDIYLRGGELHYVYVFSARQRTSLMVRNLPIGNCDVVVEVSDGAAARTVRIDVNGVPRATRVIDRSWPTYALGAGLRCGENPGSPVSGGYEGRFAFNAPLRAEITVLLERSP